MTQETKQKFEFKKKLFKTSFLILMLVLQQLMVFSPLTAFAQGATTTPNNQSGTEYKGPEQSIRDYLPGCIPSEPVTSTDPNVVTGTSHTGQQSTVADNTAKDDLYNCIQTVVRFAFVAAGITAVFMFVWAGYLYMFDSGDGKRKASGKKLMTNVIIGIVLLGCTYIFLRFINPNILVYRTFQQANITGGDHPDSIFGGQAVRDPVTGISSGGNPGSLPPGGKCLKDACPKPDTFNPPLYDISQDGVICKNNCYINPNYKQKVLDLKNYLDSHGGPSLRVTEAYPPTSNHASVSHYNGKTIDISPDSKSVDNYNKYCIALKAVGLSNFANEATGDATECGKTSFVGWSTGPHIHVNLY